MFRLVSYLILSSFLFSFTHGPSKQKVEVLYYSLDRESIPQLLSFYQLYSETDCGKEALREALRLLSGDCDKIVESSLPITDLSLLSKLIGTFSKPAESCEITFSDEEIEIVKMIGRRLGNRMLEGHQAKMESDVLSLSDDQIDVARSVFLSQGYSEEKIESLESALDLMALQVLSRLSENATPEEKIIEINRLLFDEMRFRFPPKSLYAKDIDQFTFLSSVLESRRGVCLGVSVLYLSLAQRLNLELESVTPPGHIYVRTRDNDRTINIETTHRGIHIETEQYLGVETVSSHVRTNKEAVGLTHMNQASVFWQNEEYEKAVAAYRIAEKYIEDDYLLKQFLGINLVLCGKKWEGKRYLRQIREAVPKHSITSSSIVEDYLDGKVDAEGMKAVFKHVDETRESILAKQEELIKVCKKYPKFRDGHFHLAITYLQLGRYKEGIEVLDRFHKIDQNNPTVEFYLAQLYLQRLNYQKAWEHFDCLGKILEHKDHSPKVVKNLKKALDFYCPG